MDYCKYCAEYLSMSLSTCPNCGRKQDINLSNIKKRDLYNKAVELNSKLPNVIKDLRASTSILLEMIENLQYVIDGGSYSDDGLILLANSFLLLEQINRANNNKTFAITYAGTIMYHCLFGTTRIIRKINSDRVFTDILKILINDGTTPDISNFKNTFIVLYSTYFEKAVTPINFIELSKEILDVDRLDQKRRSKKYLLRGDEVNIVYLALENQFLAGMGILAGQFPKGPEYDELFQLCGIGSISNNQWTVNVRQIVKGNIEGNKIYELPLASEEVTEIIKYLRIFTNINRNVANNHYNNYFKLASSLDKREVVINKDLQKEITSVINNLQTQLDRK